MKKIAFPLLLLSLCLCSCEKKLSFEEAKEFVINHPREVIEFTYIDNLGNARPANHPTFTSLGSSGTIKTLENINSLSFYTETYDLRTLHFDFNEKFVCVIQKTPSYVCYRYIKYLDETQCVYKFVFDDRDSEFRSENCITSYPADFAGPKKPEEFVDSAIWTYGSSCITGKPFRFPITNYLEESEEEFSKLMSSYEFMVQCGCLKGKQEVKVVMDENGHLKTSSEKTKETDVIVPFVCEYTINSKGLFTEGHLFGEYNNHRHIFAEMEIESLGETFEKDMQELNNYLN